MLVTIKSLLSKFSSIANFHNFKFFSKILLFSNDARPDISIKFSLDLAESVFYYTMPPFAGEYFRLWKKLKKTEYNIVNETDIVVLIITKNFNKSICRLEKKNVKGKSWAKKRWRFFLLEKKATIHRVTIRYQLAVRRETIFTPFPLNVFLSSLHIRK